MGEFKNFRHVIYYPPDGRYTTDKLDVRKMAGRDPVTGRKVIQQVEGGSKQKARWIDWRRWPVGRDPEDDLVERVIHIRYDPMRKPMIALTGITLLIRVFSAFDIYLVTPDLFLPNSGKILPYNFRFKRNHVCPRL